MKSIYRQETMKKVIFDEKVGYELLKELNLDAKIVSIEPGDNPILCYSQKLIYLDKDSHLVVCDREEYF